MRVRRATGALAAVALGFVLAALVPSVAHAAAPTRTPIEHFIFLMQGERSFDNYFGTFPGADGIPADACMPVSLGRGDGACVRPYPLHESAAQLGASDSLITNQIHGGKMDGFVDAYTRQGRDGTSSMGYYDGTDLPTYWDIARQYVLFDRFFSSAPYGIRLNRSYWVSAAPPGTDPADPGGYGNQPTIFDRLSSAGVSWKFYVENYQPAQTYRAAADGDSPTQTARVPLLNYARFLDDPRLSANIVDLSQYYRDVDQGTLPAVAYVVTSGANERAAGSIDAGQRLVRTMVNRLMDSSAWERSAFMWSYDGSGGWYDHVPPPTIDGQPAGLRVPALLVSPYARSGYVEHTQLDYAGALKFIEDNWNVAPLTSRDAASGSIADAFDFAAAPRAARIIHNGPVTAPAGAGNVAMIYGWYGGATVFMVTVLVVAAVMARPRPTRRPAPPGRILRWIRGLRPAGIGSPRLVLRGAPSPLVASPKPEPPPSAVLPRIARSPLLATPRIARSPLAARSRTPRTLARR